MKHVLAAAAVLAASAGMASAQDFSLNPTFGTYALESGFLPDPQSVQVNAGGSIDASSAVSSQCAGMIANAPDLRLNWSGGQFSIFVTSNTDTTLVVNGADGQWYCNDDWDGLDPRVTMSGSGQYDIWVGTFGGGIAPATVSVTEY